MVRFPIGCACLARESPQANNHCKRQASRPGVARISTNRSLRLTLHDCFCENSSAFRPINCMTTTFPSFFRRILETKFRHRAAFPSVLLLSAAALLSFSGCRTTVSQRSPLVPKWSRFEQTFVSDRAYPNAIQDAELRVFFTSPSGHTRMVDGFWDGNRTWKVRFAPDEVGKWYYSTSCSDRQNKGLHDRAGTFVCTAATGKTPFEKHGPIKVSRDGRYLEHADGTPFFWLADTAWNGALLSTDSEWTEYLQVRNGQKFTAVQWVATQWRAAPNGDRHGQLAYTGREKIEVNPQFFQRLDAKADAVNRAGLLNVPVLLWAIGSGADPSVNPGFSLPEEQAIRLARYMVARWGANGVVWFLGGDGDYREDKAARWKRIGRGVFGDREHAPVVMHPGGMHWIWDEFKNERWVDIHGYQSGHGDDDRRLKWIFAGPPSLDWTDSPPRPFINLEPPYENHIAYQIKTRITPEMVRRASYWSLLNAPTAGVSYGGHGVWGWDDGTTPPTDHPNSGVPLPWRQALRMPGAQQMRHLAAFFTAIDFWRLRPANDVLAKQPGLESPRQHIAASRSSNGDLIVIYSPAARSIHVFQSVLPAGFSASWFNPRTGQASPVVAVLNENSMEFATPDEGDWLLLVKSGG